MITFEKLQLVKEMITLWLHITITGFLLDYKYFKKHYKMISIDLRKKQALDVDPKATQQINFVGNIPGANNRKIFFIMEEAKETILDFSQGAVKVL